MNGCNKTSGLKVGLLIVCTMAARRVITDLTPTTTDTCSLNKKNDKNKTGDC